MITNTESGTNLHEIAEDIYRINTPVSSPNGDKFNFNQYLVADDQPMIFHTGPRALFPFVSEAISRVLPLETLRYIGISHFESDECGALNEFLAIAPRAEAVGSRIAAMVSLTDYANRKPRALADGEDLVLGKHVMRWLDTPHVPHGWDCGLMFDTSTDTFFAGDLFTQGGAGETALTESDILGPSEAYRAPLDYYAHAPQTLATLERLAELNPKTLACMHGSAWRGDGAALLRELGAAVTAQNVQLRAVGM
ncbi:MAG TPA: MBL fold metallo-hydrolase [Woeseiaceae bacterium]|nr:MBL fold metallo-hydrolase [Woeseiaceae bacterium]